MSYPAILSAVERAVRNEREAQDAKWGEQNHHPNGTDAGTVWVFSGPAAYVAESARTSCQRLAEEGHLTWRDILLEEVAEAFAEQDPDKLRTELIQVAAVAQAWIESIDRQKWGSS